MVVAPTAGAAPVPVPAFQGWLAILLLVTLLLIGASCRRVAGFFGIAICSGMLLAGNLMSSSALAATHVEVLLSVEPKAPTPEEVVDWGAAQITESPPLEALYAEAFLSIDYLIPERFRTQGDAKAILATHPDSPQALLERFVVVTYPDGADIENALDAFSADPFVVTAAVMETYTFHGVTLQSFGIDGPSNTREDQWHLDHHKIPKAWQ